MRRTIGFRTLVPAIVTGYLAALALVGCGELTHEPAAIAEARESCSECHTDVVDAYASGPHADQGCEMCHTDAIEHAADPEVVAARIDWRVDSCARCHEAYATMFLYDDNLKVGPFGGSQREPAIHKADEFPKYNTIVAGHGFTRDYREEGAHRYTLEEHYETLRGKFETCLQCKSTKIAWAWERGLPLTVDEERVIALTHTATEDSPAREVTVPAGTVVTLGTDFESYEVSATAAYPDGRTYTSRPGPHDDALEHQNMLWAAAVAATKETMPYGAGCNHCHDPHSGSPRVLRAAMLDAIEGGGPDGQGGVNPYDPAAGRDFDSARTRDRDILLCAQCHVEYTCGRSGVDGIVRDHYGWAKATDLHDLYEREFGYTQDWTHAIIGEPLIKSQHPETELFWGSVHYSAGASCSSCHMPRVRTQTGEWVTSHWMTSPYKYHVPDVYRAFAEASGLRSSIDSGPCATCHPNRMQAGIEQQLRVYERQTIVQDLLGDSVRLLGQVREERDAGADVDATLHAAAIDAHRRAHVIWENLIVSENSMGFHNYGEVMDALDAAEEYAREAIALAGDVLSPE